MDAERFDLVIRGGTILDGTGAPAREADIGIRDDRIAAVGDLKEAAAGRVLDATGLRVAPGFVDIHTHSDISVTYHPEQESAIAMGVTTQIVGNCGLSMGLATDAPVFAFEKRWLAPHGARITWKTFAEHLHLIEEKGVATNFIPLAGHGTLRKRVMGTEERPPEKDDMALLRRELDAALSAGAWGMSSGLEYPPSSYADEDELTALCEVVAAHGGFYATHLRDEGDMLVEAVQEALNISERARLPLQLSHHKAEGVANWGKVKITLGMVEEARGRGVNVQMDQYPYTAFMTSLSIQILPRRVLSGSTEEIAARLTDPEQRAAIERQILDQRPDWADDSENGFWNRVQIGVCRGRPEVQGLTIRALAQEAGKSPLDTALDLIAETHGYVSAVNFAIGEEDIAEVMRYAWTSIGSDGVGTHPGGTASADKVHPRAYGTFPRVLGRYVRELGVISEAEAIHKMTGLPAARIGLKERGLLAPGYFADITIYDPATISDRATFADPHQFAAGIAYVLVNGRIALEAGQPNGARAGLVLRHS